MVAYSTYHDAMYSAFYQGDGNFSNLSEATSCNATAGLGTYLAFVTMISSSVSILGSALIIVTFIMWKDIRTVARAIVVFLAVADFFTAAGYLFGAIVTYTYRNDENANHGHYDKMCEFQSFITTAFPISSFLWTAHLATYLYVAIVNAKPLLAKKLLIVFHITGWGIPLAICIPAVWTGHLGTANSRTSVSWCFVKFNDTNPNSTHVFTERLAEYYGFELLCGKFWEIATYFVALMLYVSVKVVLRKRTHQTTYATESNVAYGSLSMEKKMTEAMVHLDQKLIFIPLVFILLRLWGTLRFFISFSPSCHRLCGDYIVIGNPCKDALYNPFLLVMQAICDPGQGWGNALIFVIFHRTLAKRLCPCLFLAGRKLETSYQAHVSKNQRQQSGVNSGKDPLLQINHDKSGTSPLPGEHAYKGNRRFSPSQTRTSTHV